MKVQFHGEFNQEGYIRHHPWRGVEHDARGAYYNFKENPELISEVLEDFKEWGHYEAIPLFYEMLRWLNGPDSLLESNDCALDGPHPNTIKAVDKPITCGGRLMVFFRNLKFNTSEQHIEWLLGGMEHYLSAAPGNALTYAQLSFFKTLYTQMPGGKDQQLGKEVVCEFWAWGDTEEEVMENFKLIVSNIFDALKKISDKIRELSATGSNS